MCRLLAVRKEKEFSIATHLKIFAKISKESEEYQGHGWGIAYLVKSRWVHYKNIKPIWKDNLDQFGKTRLLIVHARSAFQDKGIVVENNMPFYDDNYIYIFNGQLSGVKINEKGRIGAEKIFNYIKRFNGNTEEMLQKGIEQLKLRTKYYKAINIILSDSDKFYVTCNFNERPGYFQMYFNQDDGIIVCSDPYPNGEWKKIKNGSVKVL